MSNLSFEVFKDVGGGGIILRLKLTRDFPYLPKCRVAGGYSLVDFGRLHLSVTFDVAESLSGIGNC